MEEKIRSIGIRLGDLDTKNMEQVSFFSSKSDDNIQKLLDNINEKYHNTKEQVIHSKSWLKEHINKDTISIDNIIDNNAKKRKKEIDDITGDVTWRYQDNRGNTVITDEFVDRIITVYSHPKTKNAGKYITKGVNQLGY